MEIWLTTIGQRLDDADNTRTMLLAHFLLERGHRVTLWTSAFDHIRKKWRQEWRSSDGFAYEMDNGLIIRFMKGCGYQRNISLKRFRDHILAAHDFRKKAELLPAPDAIIASLPDHFTAAAAVDFASEFNIPVIVDVRDKWPDVFADYSPTILRPIAKLALLFESRRAKRTLARASCLVAMMHSMLDWGLEKGKRERSDNDQVFFLSTMEMVEENSAPLEVLKPEHQQLLNAAIGKTVFSFIGTFNKTQHPLLILEALNLLAQNPDFDPGTIEVFIGGDGQDAIEVNYQIDKLDWVHSLGWLKPEEMRAVLVRSNFGLLPMNFASPAFNNKAFAYLACGLPIINCALGDLAELIDRENVGINIPAGDPQAMASAISNILRERDNTRNRRKQVQAVYSRLFDQQNTYNSYVEHIEKIVAES